MSKETDKYLKDVFVKIKDMYTEEYNYIKDFNTPEYEEIKAEYLESIKNVEEVYPKLKNIDSLIKITEDELQTVYEGLEYYENNFVFSPDGSRERAEQDKEYGKLSYILEMFDLDDYDEE